MGKSAADISSAGKSHGRKFRKAVYKVCSLAIPRCVTVPGAQIPASVLADTLGRLSIALAAGVDLRRAVASETARVPRRWRPVFEAAAAGVNDGEPLGVALARAGDAVPADVRGMIDVGDRTGRDAETLREIAQALRDTVAARRAFLMTLVGPAMRLAVALAVIGVLMLLAGSMTSLDGRPLDILGLGLTGTRGLAIYLEGLVILAVAVGFAMPWLSRSWRDHGVVRRLLDRLPLVGPAARAGEAARWCRAAALAAHAGIDAGGLVSLASAAAPGMAIGRLRVEEALRAHAEPAVAAADDLALRRNGFILCAVRVDRMESLRTALGGSAMDIRTWLGTATTQGVSEKCHGTPATEISPHSGVCSVAIISLLSTCA